MEALDESQSSWSQDREADIPARTGQGTRAF